MRLALTFCIMLSYGIVARSQTSKGSCSVNISLANSVHGMAYLQFFNHKGRHLDSTTIQNGHAQFYADLQDNEVQRATLRLKLDNGQTDACSFFLQTQSIAIVGNSDLNDITFSGSSFQSDYSLLYKNLTPSRKLQKLLDKEFENAESKADRLKSDSIVNYGYPKMVNQKQATIGLFIKTYPNSDLIPFIFDEFVGDTDVDFAKVDSVLAILSDKNKRHPKVVTVVERMERQRRVSIGMIAPNFSMPDTLGNMLGLSDLRGKYVLVDFWASWCGPCRRETPNLIVQYSKYKDKGFEILSVSLDGERRAWLNAIRKDKMNWLQISDLKIFKNSAAVLYGVSSIPQNILIDPTGKIIAKNLKGDVLAGKLSSIFK